MTTPEFWLARWQNQQIGWHRDDVNELLLRFYARLGLNAADEVFVPLCGKAVEMAWIVEQGQRVFGVELSDSALTDFADEQSLRLTASSGDCFHHWQSSKYRLWSGDFFDLNANDLHGVQAVFDRASLVALPKSQRSRYAKHLLAILPPNVPILLILLTYDQTEMNGPPFGVSAAEVNELFGQGYNLELLASSDVLEQEPRFKQRGVTSFTESALLLSPK